jgi:hypothetical protein
MSMSRWLDERLDSVSFRLRLFRMALRRLDDLPAGVVMALEAPDYDLGCLREHDRVIETAGL